MSGVIEPGCKNLFQGDVVLVPTKSELLIEGDISQPTSQAFAVLSQRCDLVQPSKENCAIAPLVDGVNAAVLSLARKGKTPLRLYLRSGDGSERIADLERIVTIPKKTLEGETILARVSSVPSSYEARQLAARIGAVFERFPFPDSLFDVLKAIRSDFQTKADKNSSIGLALGMVITVRVYADQWSEPNRRVHLLLIVDHNFIPAEDDFIPSTCSTHSPTVLETWDRTRTCKELVRINQALKAGEDDHADCRSSLWDRFGKTVREQANLNVEENGVPAVASLEVEVLSEDDLSYSRYRRTQSLELEMLSDARTARDNSQYLSS